MPDAGLRHTLVSSSQPNFGCTLTNTALVNRHFATTRDLEEAGPARCVALQLRPNLIRSTMLFHWWPKRIKKRQGSRRNEYLWFRARRSVSNSAGAAYYIVV
ncbi:MAG: hypothetical protein ACLQUY_20845 [Ktedonobacterales bacterium]